MHHATRTMLIAAVSAVISAGVTGYVMTPSSSPRKVHKLAFPLLLTGAGSPHQNYLLPEGTSLYYDQAFPEGFVRYKVYVNVEGVKLESHESPEKLWLAPLTAFPVDADQVVIKPNEPGPDFAARYAGLVKVQHQPAGIDFYSIDWTRSPDHGQVRVDHRRHSFVIQNALSVLATQDLGALKQEGLFEFSIGAAVAQTDLISHDDARIKIYAILQKILDAGWETRLYAEDPRLRGKERLAYVLNNTNTIGLDPRYIPTFQEWMRIPSRTLWMFYADGLFMDVSFTRERTMNDPEKPGAYIISFSIKTEAEYFRGYVEAADRERWKQVLPGVLSKLAAIRAKHEAELRIQGVAIDDSYQDPPLPKLTP